jgi:hypothetical protein
MGAYGGVRADRGDDETGELRHGNNLTLKYDGNYIHERDCELEFQITLSICIMDPDLLSVMDPNLTLTLTLALGDD